MQGLKLNRACWHLGLEDLAWNFFLNLTLKCKGCFLVRPLPHHVQIAHKKKNTCIRNVNPPIFFSLYTINTILKGLLKGDSMGGGTLDHKATCPPLKTFREGPRAYNLLSELGYFVICITFYTLNSLLHPPPPTAPTH